MSFEKHSVVLIIQKIKSLEIEFPNFMTHNLMKLFCSVVMKFTAIQIAHYSLKNTEICEICNSVEKLDSKVTITKIKLLRIPAKSKALHSLTSPDRIKLTLQDQRLKCVQLQRKIDDMAIELKKVYFFS